MNGLDYFRAAYGLGDDALLVPYGSRVYGTATDKSDYDYLAIVPANRKADTGTEYRRDDINIHIFNRVDFQEQLDLHKVHCLEAYFLPDGAVAKQFGFKLDLSRLRRELAAKASHSFVKAKKKIEVEKDYYIGWKSLFHSLRILTFGIQIAKQGRITNYAGANGYWFTIRDSRQYNWDWFKSEYQPVYNELSTEFRQAAPK